MNGGYRVSLDVAQQLKENGYPQDGCDAYWVLFEREHYILFSFQIELDKCGLTKPEYKVICAAPCVGRLGEDLPTDLLTDEIIMTSEQAGFRSKGHLEIWQIGCKNDKKLHAIQYAKHGSPKHIEVDSIMNESEADARALMWIELKKKGLL